MRPTQIWNGHRRTATRYRISNLDATRAPWRVRSSSQGAPWRARSSSQGAPRPKPPPMRRSRCRRDLFGVGFWRTRTRTLLSLKESSIFRNERDAVSAGIRDCPNPQTVFHFLPTWHPAADDEAARAWARASTRSILPKAGRKSCAVAPMHASAPGGAHTRACRAARGALP